MLTLTQYLDKNPTAKGYALFGIKVAIELVEATKEYSEKAQALLASYLVKLEPTPVTPQTPIESAVFQAAPDLVKEEKTRSKKGRHARLGVISKNNIQTMMKKRTHPVRGGI